MDIVLWICSSRDGAAGMVSIQRKATATWTRTESQ